MSDRPDPSVPPDQPALAALPALATWHHRGATEGYEVLAPRSTADGDLVLAGHTTGVEDGHGYALGYRIEVDARGRTRTAALTAWWPHGSGATTLRSDGDGRWTVDGTPRPDLDGLLDVDLEWSACTNTLPVRRLALAEGASAPAPAAYVRTFDLAVERLDQTYARRPDPADGSTAYAYDCPTFAVHCDLVYDASGLVRDYPGIAVRSL